MTALEQYLGGLSDKRVGVIGAGVSNMPLIRMLRAAGVCVTVHDKKTRQSLATAMQRWRRWAWTSCWASITWKRWTRT